MSSSPAHPDQGLKQLAPPVRVPNELFVSMFDVFDGIDGEYDPSFVDSLSAELKPTYHVQIDGDDQLVTGQIEDFMTHAIIEVKGCVRKNTYHHVIKHLELLSLHMKKDDNSVCIVTYQSQPFYIMALLSLMVYNELFTGTIVRPVTTLPRAFQKRIDHRELDDEMKLLSLVEYQTERREPVSHRFRGFAYLPREQPNIKTLPRNIGAPTFGNLSFHARIGDLSAVLRCGEHIFWMEILEEYHPVSGGSTDMPTLWFNGCYNGNNDWGENLAAVFVRQFFAMTGVEWNKRHSFNWSAPRSDRKLWTYIGDSHETYCLENWHDHEPHSNNDTEMKSNVSTVKRNRSRDTSPERK